MLLRETANLWVCGVVVGDSYSMACSNRRGARSVDGRARVPILPFAPGEGELFLPVECQATGTLVNRVTRVVDVHCLAAGTGAGLKLWDAAGLWGIPQGVCLLSNYLLPRIVGCPQRCVFKASCSGFALGVSVRDVANIPVYGGKWWEWIRPFPFVGLYQIKEAALLYTCLCCSGSENLEVFDGKLLRNNRYKVRV